MTDVDPDVVWAKLVGYPWWPARTAKARLPGEKVRVDFLGTGDHAELVNDDYRLCRRAWADFRLQRVHHVCLVRAAEASAPLRNCVNVHLASNSVPVHSFGAYS